MNESTRLLLSDALSFLNFLDENAYISLNHGQEVQDLILRLRAELKVAESQPKETLVGMEQWDAKETIVLEPKYTVTEASKRSEVRLEEAVRLLLIIYSDLRDFESKPEDAQARYELLDDLRRIRNFYLRWDLEVGKR